MPGKQGCQLACSVAAPVCVGCGLGLDEQAFDLLVLLDNHAKPLFARNKRFDLSACLGTLLVGSSGGNGGGNSIEK